MCHFPFVPSLSRLSLSSLEAKRPFSHSSLFLSFPHLSLSSTHNTLTHTHTGRQADGRTEGRKKERKKERPSGYDRIIHHLPPHSRPPHSSPLPLLFRACGWDCHSGALAGGWALSRHLRVVRLQTHWRCVLPTLPPNTLPYDNATPWPRPLFRPQTPTRALRSFVCVHLTHTARQARPLLTTPRRRHTSVLPDGPKNKELVCSRATDPEGILLRA